MRDLIRKILREQNCTIVSLEIIEDLSEYKDELDFLIENAQEFMTREFEEKLYKYIRKKSPFYGVFNRKDGSQIKYKFTLSVGQHWKERVFRKKDPKYANDPTFKDIDFEHSIDIITSNPNKLAKLLSNKKIKDNIVVNIGASDGSQLHMLVKCVPKSLDGRDVQLILLNQIRGADFYKKEGEEKIYLP